MFHSRAKNKLYYISKYNCCGHFCAHVFPIVLSETELKDLWAGMPMFQVVHNVPCAHTLSVIPHYISYASLLLTGHPSLALAALPWSRNHTQITCVVREVAGNPSIKANNQSISPDVCRNGKESIKSKSKLFARQIFVISRIDCNACIWCFSAGIFSTTSLVFYNSSCVILCVCVETGFSRAPQNCHSKFNRLGKLGGPQAQSDLFWPINRVNLIGGF